MAFKVPKFGEGTRERKKSNYGEGGRAVGGEARRKQLAHKTASKVSKSKTPLPVKDMPEPGGHPQHLIDAAREKGRTIPPANAFQKLKALQVQAEKRAEGMSKALQDNASHDVAEPGGTGLVSSDILDQLFEQRREVERPTRARAERKAKLAKMRERLPILKYGGSDGVVEEPSEKTQPSPKGARDDARAVIENAPSANLSSQTVGRGGGDGRSNGAEQANPNQLSLFPLETLGGMNAGTVARELGPKDGSGARSNNYHPERRGENLPAHGRVLGGAGDEGSISQDVLPVDASGSMAVGEDHQGKLAVDSGRDGNSQGASIGSYPDRREAAGRGIDGQETVARSEMASQELSLHPQGAGQEQHIPVDILPGRGEKQYEADGVVADIHRERVHLPVLGGDRETDVPSVATLCDTLPGAPPAHGRVEGRNRNTPILPDTVTPYSPDVEEDVAHIMGLPGVNCNNCPAAESCPEFKENAACYYDEEFQGLSSRDLGNLVPAMEVIADIQFKRALRGYLIEQRAAGGHIDPNVTRQFEIAAMARERVARLKAPVQKQAYQSISIVAKQSGPNAVASGGGLVSKLLAGVTGSLPAHDDGELVLNAERGEEVD